MRYKLSQTRFIACVLFAVACSFVVFEARSLRASGVASAEAVVVNYEGVLRDENNAPITGVFPLSFQLYAHANAAHSFWSETHFLAVVDGAYTVPLGKIQPLAASELLSSDVWIAIELAGEGEILRDKLVLNDAESLQAYLDQLSSSSPGPTARAGQRQAFAQVAERAMTAERALVAENAEKLGGLTHDDVEAMANLALQKLGEHIANPDAHQATSRPRLGNEEQTMHTAGGGGGSPFDIRCPPGQVVVGIEGRSGRVIDNITVVCSPIR